MTFLENFEKLVKQFMSIKPNCPYEQGSETAQVWHDGYISAVCDIKNAIDVTIEEINVEGRV